jgi:WD40 repeat protein
LAVNTFHVQTGAHSVFVWDTSNLSAPSLVLGFPRPHPFSKDLAWAPDNNLLAITRSDEVQIWNVTTGAVVTVLDSYASPHALDHVVWNADGTRLAASISDRVYVWDISGTDYSLVATLPFAHASYYDIVWSPSGDRLAVGDPSEIAVWEWSQITGTYQQIASLSGHTDEVRRLDWKGERLASSSFDETIRLWDTLNWELLGTLPGSGVGEGTDRVLSLTPDGQQVAYAGPNGRLVVATIATLAPPTPTVTL